MSCPNFGRGLSCPYQDGSYCNHPEREDILCEFGEEEQ